MMSARSLRSCRVNLSFPKCIFIVLMSIGFGNAKYQNDFFVTSKNGTFYCITNSTFALSWIDEDISAFSNSVSAFFPRSQNSNYEWRSQADISRFKWIQSDVILDRRWEEMQVHMTVPGEKITVQSRLENSFIIPLSIRTAQEADIFLCDDKDAAKSDCYWFTLQADNTKESLIRKCENGGLWHRVFPTPCKVVLTTPKIDDKQIPNINDVYLTNKKWSHFKLIKRRNEIFFIKTNGITENIIMKYSEKKDKINVSHMIIDSPLGNGLWKIHELEYIYLRPNGNIIKLGPAIAVVDGSVCISMFILMCKLCKIKLSLRSPEDINHIIEEKQFNFTGLGKWHQIKYVFENIEDNKVVLYVFPTSETGQWAIDEIRQCQKEEFRKISLDGSQIKPTCQLISDDDRDHIVFFQDTSTNIENNCPEDRVGDICVPCNWIDGDENCENVKICQQYGTTQTMCSCSAGFTYNYCQSECPTGTYGHNCNKKCGKCDGRCDNINGTCSTCLENYRGPKCDIPPAIVFKNPPEITNITYTGATIHIRNFELLNVKNNEQPVDYVIQYKRADDDDRNWNEIGPKFKFNEKISVHIRNLKIDTKYVVGCKVNSVSMTENLNFMTLAWFTTKCEEITEENIQLRPSNTSINIAFIDKTSRTCNTSKYDLRIFGPEGQKGFNELTPFTEYKVILSKSSYLAEKSFRTTEGVPHQVTNLSIYSKNENSISLRWKPPHPPTGLLADYKFKYYCFQNSKHTYENLLISAMKVSCKLWPEFHCTTLFRLFSNLTYLIKVSARNEKPQDFGKLETIECTTKTEPPEAPYDLNLRWTPTNDLELEWKHPNVTNGDIEYFQIKINSERNISKIEKQLPVKNKYNLTYYYKIEATDLLPSNKYKIEVSAHNDYDGEEVTEIDTSPPDVPSLDDDPEISYGNKTITVKISPIEPKGKTETYGLLLLVFDETANTKSHPELEKNFQMSFSKFRIVLECSLKHFDQSYSFSISDDSRVENCNRTTNFSLNPGTSYNIIVILTNSFGNKTRYKIHSLLYDSATSTSSNLSLLALLLLLLIIPVAAIIFMNRRVLLLKYTTIKSHLSGNEILCEECEIPLATTHNKHSNNDNNITIYSKSIKTTQFEQYVKESIENGELERQHALFPSGQTQPWDCASLNANKPKNRYLNLRAYDHSRVVLDQIPGDQHSDYINANYIDGWKIPKAYIATQGPKADTLYDFWRMVWQENVEHIAMLANIYEGGKKKVEQYWPPINGELELGEITVHQVAHEVFADYEYREFNMTRNEITRKVDQLHFTSWPDHGVPLYPHSLVPFLRRVLKLPLKTRAPIVVHCSAGVGRTGTVILSDACLRMAGKEGTIDALRNLQKLREQRPNMVDNIEQYKLAHLLILECLTGLQTDIPCEEIAESVHGLLESGRLKAQMLYLKRTQWQDEAMKTVALRDETIMIDEKNRFQNIIPETQGRVLLSCCPKDDPKSSYINAVKVDCIRSPGRFIVTQQPMPTTLGDFWRLVEETNATVVISLNEINLEDPTSCSFWPTATHPRIDPIDHITLKYLHTLSSDHHDLITIEMLLHAQDPKMISIVSMKGWPAMTNCPGSVGRFVHFCRRIDGLVAKSSPVVVTCYDGALASGLYVAMRVVVARIQLEQVCDVCQAVRMVRHNRSQFVQEEKQFAFLYRAAVEYVNRVQSISNDDHYYSVIPI